MGKTKIMVSGENNKVIADSLLSKLGLQDIDKVLHFSRMRWYGHVERSKGWISRFSRMRWYGHAEHSKGWISQVRKLNG